MAEILVLIPKRLSISSSGECQQHSSKSPMNVFQSRALTVTENGLYIPIELSRRAGFGDAKCYRVNILMGSCLELLPRKENIVNSPRFVPVIMNDMSIRVPFSFIKRIGGTTGSLYFARAVDRKILLAANFDYEAISVHGSTNSDALREEQARIALKYPMPLVPLTGKELVRRCRSIAADGLSEMKQCRLSGYIYPDQIGKFRRALAKAEGKPLPPMEI